MLPFYLKEPNPGDYLSLPFFALDFETTNIEFGNPVLPENKLVLAVVQKEGHAPKEIPIDRLRRHIPRKGVLVAHNAKFELGWLIRHGVDISNLLVWDTMIAEYVIYGNQQVPLDLDSVCGRWGLPGKERVIDALMKGGVCPSQMPRARLLARCLRDVETTGRLFVRQMHYIHTNGLLPVMFTRCITTPVLAYIERQGMTLDEQRVGEEVTKARCEKARIEQELAGMAGGRNLNSRPQLAEFLYDVLKFEEVRDKRGNPRRTATGRRATDKAVLAALSASTQEQKRFLELQVAYAQVSAALSKSLEFFANVCAEQSGTFYGFFNQCRTKTHRLSSSARRLKFKDGTTRGVQFQNMPRAYKRLLKSRKGRLVESDGSGLEFRVAVDLGHDRQGRTDILDPEHDPHTYTSTIINRIPREQVTKALRTAAKSRTFKPLFSEGKTGTPREVAYYKDFKQRYSGITETQEAWVAEVLRTGQLRIASGLVCYWDLKVSPSGYIEGANQVRNLPVQSFATADIIPVSLAYTFWRSRFAVDADILNTVHDSVVADVAEKDVDKYRAIVIRSFLDDTYQYLERVYGHTMFVPLGVGITTGTHWGEGEEETFSYEQNDRAGIQAVRQRVSRQDSVELPAGG
jgi:DNA polymerase I-like protein with 3'-5' exonuclease and polymerase domains